MGLMTQLEVDFFTITGILESLSLFETMILMQKEKCFTLWMLIMLSICICAQDVHTIIEVDSIKVNDGIVQGGHNEYYVSSFTEGSIYKFDLKGNVNLLTTGLVTSNGLYINSYGELLAADPDGNKIYKIDTTTGRFLDTISIHSPGAIAGIPGNDTLLVTDWRTNRIHKLAPDGSSSTYLSGAPLNAPVGICYLPSEQNILVANFNNRRIYRIRNNTLEYIATVPAPNTSGNRWLGFITCSNDRVFATSLNAHAIYEVFTNHTDSVRLLAGIPGRPGKTDGSIDGATFNLPNGILSIDNGDSLLVSDYGNGIIRLISLDSMVVSIHHLAHKAPLIQVFPNPVTQKLNIQIDQKLKVEEIRLTSLNGKVVKDRLTFEKKSDNLISVGLPKVYSGVYFLQLLAGETYTSTKVLIK